MVDFMKVVRDDEQRRRDVIALDRLLDWQRADSTHRRVQVLFIADDVLVRVESMRSPRSRDRSKNDGFRSAKSVPEAVHKALDEYEGR